MHKRTIIGIFVSIMSLMLLQDIIINVLSNINSSFRKNNLNTLEIEAYKDKIEYLEKEILETQNIHPNLNIYSGTSFILAKIALRDIYDFYASIIISTDNKVSINSPVINENGLVGFIGETNGLSSKVELLTTNKSLSVKVCNSYGLLNKYLKKEKLLVLSNINNYEDISNDCIVTTSGLQGIREGLKIGSVINVETKGIEKVVYVKPYVDYDNLNYLYVIES